MITIANMKTSVGEYQRIYLYKTILISVPALVESKVPNAVAKYRDYMDLFNQKGIWPERSTDAIELKWGGETAYYSGTDTSGKEGALEFHDDEAGITRDFWNACKDMTGEPEHQVAQEKINSVFSIGVMRIDVTKSVITGYRKLEDVQVFKVSESDPDKEGSGLNIITATIRWDRNLPDATQIGKAI